MVRLQFVFSLVDGHLGFCFLAVVNCTAVHICMQLFECLISLLLGV